MNDFIKDLKKEVARSRRYQHPFSILKLDIDRLSQFNQTEGKELGDKALREVSEILKKHIRETDTISESEDGSFYFLLPETALSQAEQVAERLRQAIEDSAFIGKKGTSYLTVSIGLLQYPEGAQTAEALLREADKSLREAKFLGKNRVVSSRSLSQTSYLFSSAQGG